MWHNTGRMGNTTALIEPIVSARLRLVCMGLPVLEALLREDRAAAETLLGCRVLPETPLDDLPLAMRLEQIRTDPNVTPWLLRAIIDRDTGTMIGRIGFHTAPCPEYLAEIAPDGIELGYGIDAPFRRKGYAREAAIALMRWAYDSVGQRCFVLSVSPQNLPSTAMANTLGFTPCGSHIDDEDGLEIEFIRRFDEWPPDWE